MREDGAGERPPGGSRELHGSRMRRACPVLRVALRCPRAFTHGTDPGEAPQDASETLRGAHGSQRLRCRPASTGNGAALPGPEDPESSRGRSWQQCACAKAEAANHGRRAATRGCVRHAPCSRRRACDVTSGSAVPPFPAGGSSACQRGVEGVCHLPDKEDETAYPQQT
ncbi:unnamed protein product [Bubo scandiacus]